MTRQYGRYFFGPDVARQAAEGLLGLERNWQGPLKGNAQIEKTLEIWAGMESRDARLQNNWRFLMNLQRAYFTVPSTIAHGSKPLSERFPSLRIRRIRQDCSTNF